jgi:hypothetical protein
MAGTITTQLVEYDTIKEPSSEGSQDTFRPTPIKGPRSSSEAGDGDDNAWEVRLASLVTDFCCGRRHF